MKPSYLLTLSSCLAAASILANPCELEVIHWWTSPGEAYAVSKLKQAWEAQGCQWIDTAIAGGGGANARSTAINRAVGGNPAGAAQFVISNEYKELARAGKLVDLTALAEKEGWDNFVYPQGVIDSCKVDGKWYAVPVGVHNFNWAYLNLKNYQDAGIPLPTDWDSFIKGSESFVKKGQVGNIVANQGWTEYIIFDNILSTSYGKDFYRKVYKDHDKATIMGDQFAAAIKNYGRIRDASKILPAGSAWNEAVADVVSGKASSNIMGDWAKAEFEVAGKVAGKDYECIMGPGQYPTFGTGGDVFVFFKQDNAQIEANQLKMASTFMGKKAHKAFNEAKGSLPPRKDIDLSNAGHCEKKALAKFYDPNNTSESAMQWNNMDIMNEIIQLSVGTFSEKKPIDVKSFQEKFYDILTQND